MGTEKRLGIDPVDLESLDGSTVTWNTQTQQWETADGSSVSCHMYGPSVTSIPSGKTIVWDRPTDVDQVPVDCLYDKLLDYQYYHDVFITTLYYLGFSEEEMPNISIDDVITRIRTVYNYNLNNKDFASVTYLKRKNIALIRQVRRAFHKIQVTNGY